MHVCMYACMHVCMYACMHVCMHVCMYACMHVCMHVCMYACMHACMYVCMHACMYVRNVCNVCTCMCVTIMRVKDGVCESDVSARQCRHFFARAAMSSALHAAALRTWNGLNEVFHDLLCSMWCNEMCYVTTAPVLQPRIRR